MLAEQHACQAVPGWSQAAFDHLSPEEQQMEFMLSMGVQTAHSGVENDTSLGPEEPTFDQEELDEPSGVLWQFMASHYEDSSPENQFYLSMGTMEDDNHRHHDTFKDDCTQLSVSSTSCCINSGS